MSWLAPVFLLLGLLLTAPGGAQEAASLTLYFYRDGQMVPVQRMVPSRGDTQVDAEALLAELLAGPTAAEEAQGLVSPLPPGTELIAVTVSGEAVTIDLRIPLDFLRGELDPDSSDAIVEQMVMTLHPLNLHHIQVHAEDESRNLVPVSDFLLRLSIPAPVMPLNDEPMPDWLGSPPDREVSAPEYVGQPPAFGQGQPQGALTGTTAWLSAGHGWYWSDTLGRWTTQRGNNNGLVEDFSNAEAVNYYLARYLWNAGADVWLVRERSMNRHEIIVDNDHGTPAYTETGTWETSETPGYNAGTYRWRSTRNSPSGTATWTPDLPEAGWYAVWAWYRHGANRPTDARYQIHHAGGVTTVSLSQEVHGMSWRYLGEYYFTAGSAGHVTLLDLSSGPSQAVIADAIRFGGGLGDIAEPGGTSGRPRWEEAAKYWARFQGAPPEVTTYDAPSRPLYAEWESARGYPGEAEKAVYVSWHTNGGGGTGTNSYIHSTEPTTGSVELQDWIHAELISDLRAAWDPAWVDRGQKSADFSEVRELVKIPGVLLEIAFHDNTSDASALREPFFRQLAARAVFQGIVKYQAGQQGGAAHLLPEPPVRLAARSTAPGEVTVTWAPSPCCDGVVGDAATAYKVYRSATGRAFEDGIWTADTTLTLGGLAPSSLHYFRVTAWNEGGESFPTPVVAVRTPVAGETVSFLIVDGFDRLDQAAMIPQWEAYFLGTAQRMFLERMNRYDHAVEHGQGLSTCDLAFDGAVNEAVDAGDVALDGYPAVDWFVGEESVADAALSNIERALLAAYLDGGGRLLISGAEIGYDLVENGRDPAFFEDYLRAQYLGDDADTYQFAGVADGIFDGLAGSFDDSTGGAYDVGYADCLSPAAGADAVLDYVGGTAGGAAVAYTDDSPAGFRVVHFGFPLETVTDAATRDALFCAAADYLGLTPPPPVSTVDTPRLINPGFERGLGQSAWQTEASDGRALFYARQSLPAYVEPHSGDWLAWLGGYMPGISVTTALTQVVALPSGEPTATLSLAWFVHGEGASSPGGDHLGASVYDLSGTVQAELLTLTHASPADTWYSSSLNLSAFAGETVQLAFRTVSTNTAFFLDDVQLTTTGPPGPDEIRALWVDAYHEGIKSRAQIDELIETAQAGNFNALVVQVRRRGDTYYPSALDPWAPDATPSFDALTYLIERAHAAGIEVHAWATTLAIWNGDTPPAALEHTFNLHGPDAEGRDLWLMPSYSQGITSYADVWYLDPGHPDAVDYTVAVYAELATKYDLDGVHLDRVRYPGQGWGYNPTSVSRFQAQTGRQDVPAPDDDEWLQWRRDQVTALVRKIYLTITAIRPRLRLSAALSTSGGAPLTEADWLKSTPYVHHLQDWRGWLEEGILDLGLPMTYKREYDADQQRDFDDWITWEKDHQYGRGVAVGTGLYLNTVPDSMAQWLRGRQPSALGNHPLGLGGYSYATPSNDGTSRRIFVNATVTELFAQPASLPTLPWKEVPLLGHLMGQLSQPFPCRNLDGYPLSLSGPKDHTLLADGSGWFGVVDLPPGDYLLAVELVTPNLTVQVPVVVVPGSVTEQAVRLPGCTAYFVYLPLVTK